MELAIVGLGRMGGNKAFHNCRGNSCIPTLSEISKRAAGSYFAEKLFSERTKSILRHLFHLKGRACTLPEGVE